MKNGKEEKYIGRKRKEELEFNEEDKKQTERPFMGFRVFSSKNNFKRCKSSISDIIVHRS